jgi:hypothetical protein
MKIRRRLKRAAVLTRRQTGSHPYRATVVAAIVAIGIAFAVLPFDRERSVFVSKCIENGKADRDCECTYDAKADMPPIYWPVAKTWAHGTATEYIKAKALFQASEFGRALKKQLDSLLNAPKADTHTSKSWWSSLTSAGGRATALAKRAFGPGTKIEIAHDTTAAWMSARSAYGKHCRGAADRLIGAADDAKSAVVKTANDLGMDSVKKAEAIGTTAKYLATKLKDQVTGWWK